LSYFDLVLYIRFTVYSLQVRTSGKKPPAVAVQGALADLKEEIMGLKLQFQQQAGMMQQ